MLRAVRLRRVIRIGAYWLFWEAVQCDCRATPAALESYFVSADLE